MTAGTKRDRRAPSESQLIGVLSGVFARGAHAPQVTVGIGDDAACLRFSGNLVASVDAQVEGTHFRREWVSLEDIGYRSFQAAISDLAAMGASAVAALSHLTLPRDFTAAELRRLTRGQQSAAQECDCPMVGGNLSRGSGISVVTTVLGRATRCLSRAGAVPGDEVWLLGEVGLARAGLELLLTGKRPRSRAALRALQAWRRPRARLESGRLLVGRAHACMDLSDGLGSDAPRLAQASGVRLEVDAASLRAALPPELHDLSRSLDRAALDLACEGGEDYALLAAGPRKRRPAEAVSIGRVCEGAGAWLVVDGDARPLSGGFDHFARQSAPRAQDVRSRDR